MLTRFLAIALLTAAPLLSSSAQAADDCGITEEVIPDFSLVDQNPNSPTFVQTWTRDALLGQVLVIYWAQAT